jgi:predicted NBD/HSP70 family sugar kinase
MIRIGIDLGGTKIEIVALDEQRRTLLRRRVLCPSGDYGAIVATIVRLIAECEPALTAQGQQEITIGIGTPGTMSRASGTLKNSNSVCLNGQPLLQDLQARIGRPLRMANDANCFALSEAIDGAAAGADTVFGVILGTGVGGGLVVQRRVLTGPNGIAGEWGHNPLPIFRGAASPEDLPAPLCYCGRAGCVETYLSGPGWAADHLRRAGQRLSAENIVAQARAGDAACAHSLALYVERLARSLATVINIVDPDVIVLGGGLSNIDELYVEAPKCWGRYVFSDTVETRLVRHQHGDSSGVRGAALLWQS